MGQNYITGRTAVEIYSSARAAIEAGQLAPGAALPPVRSLAEQLGVNRNTVSSAYQRLAASGLVEGDRRGLKVATRVEPMPSFGALGFGPGVRDLSFGNPSREFLPALGDALAAAARRPHQLYGDEAELPGLLEIASHGAQADGVPSSPGTLMFANGALDGIERVLAAHLAPGDVVALEEPCFTRVLHLLRAMGFVVVGVAIDMAGPRPEAVAAAIAAKARALIVTPVANNPTGATLTTERASELRPVLEAAPDLLLIEDDHFSRLAQAPFVTLASAERRRWAVVRSVSKHFGPDLRLAYLHADITTIVRVRARQSVGTAWVSHVIQAAVLHLERDPGARAQIGQAGREYARRRSALVAALKERGIGATAVEGFNVWVPTPHEGEIARRLLTRGWVVRTGDAFRVAGRGGTGLRITTSTLTEDEAPEFAAALAAVLTPTTRTASA